MICLAGLWKYNTVQATNMFTETLLLSSQYYASSKTQINHHPGHISTINVEFQKCTTLATVNYYYYYYCCCCYCYYHHHQQQQLYKFLIVIVVTYFNTYTNIPRPSTSELLAEFLLTAYQDWPRVPASGLKY